MIYLYLISPRYRCVRIRLNIYSVIASPKKLGMVGELVCEQVCRTAIATSKILGPAGDVVKMEGSSCDLRLDNPESNALRLRPKKITCIAL